MKLAQGLLASLPLSSIDRSGYTVVPTAGDLAVLVYFHNGEPKAVWDFCPHMGAPLSQGRREGTHLHCPWHGYDFDGADGRMVHNPNDRIFAPMKGLYKTFDASKTPCYRLKHLQCEIVGDVLKVSTGPTVESFVEAHLEA